MKKIVIGEPVIVSQSTTEPIVHGGWQDPEIRCKDGVLYVRFSGVKDDFENRDRENLNPVYKSIDGKRWEKVANNRLEWTKAQPSISTGEKVRFTGLQSISDPDLLKKIGEPKECRGASAMKFPPFRGLYTKDELRAVLGDTVDYIVAKHIVNDDTNEVETRLCKVDWDDVVGVKIYNGYVNTSIYAQPHRQDKDGSIYLPVATFTIDSNGLPNSGYRSMAMLKSTDEGETWEYQGICRYEDEYNIPSALEIEGFNEAAFEICDDGSFFMIMRSGSISPFAIGDDDHPAPKCMITYSYDKGKTWTTPEIFYDYGVLPRSGKLGDGTILMTSGRPDVYVRACFDGKGKEWDDVVHVLEVPKEKFYNGYWEYTCSNNGICAYDDTTAYLTYSNFQLKTPEGVRAKSIIVRKISIVEE